LADENRIFWGEELKSGKFSTEADNFSEIGGKFETEGNSTLPQRGWTPWSL